MRAMTEVIFIFCFFLLNTRCVDAQTVAIRGGATLTPGVYAAFRYEHFTNSMVNLAGGLFLENSRKNRLNYSSVGIDLLAEYTTADDDQPMISGKAGIGGTCELVNEPWVYKDLSTVSRLNYGILA
ncbi:MAG: hypothetical protein ABI581_05120, partial [Sediminibacterium sp.]